MRIFYKEMSILLVYIQNDLLNFIRVPLPILFFRGSPSLLHGLYYYVLKAFMMLQDKSAEGKFKIFKSIPAKFN
jgi:hypothetical protein